MKLIVAAGLLFALFGEAEPSTAGMPYTVRRVSLGSEDVQGHGHSSHAALSADGRFVVFVSEAANLVASDLNKSSDVFVRDLLLGLTRRVSVSSEGEEGNAPSFGPTISGDGRIVAFVSDASNLVQEDTNGATDVFAHDLVSGRTHRISVSPSGEQAIGFDPFTGEPSAYYAASLEASISSDGNAIAFTSRAQNLTEPRGEPDADIFVRETFTPSTLEIVSISTDGVQGNDSSYSPSISADGRYVAFSSDASNLIARDGNDLPDVFVRDRLQRTTTRESESFHDGDASGLAYGSFQPSLSADGRYLAFTSDAIDLVPTAANGSWNVYVRDRLNQSTIAVSYSHRRFGSLALPSLDPQGHSYGPSISADGRYVAFHSLAEDLVEEDASDPPEPEGRDNQSDVFLHDLLTRHTTRISKADDGSPGNNGSYLPSISASGQAVAFTSYASNLVSDDTNGDLDVFLWRNVNGDRAERHAHPYQRTRAGR